MPKPVCFAEPPSPHLLATPLGPSFGPLEASVPGDFVPSVPADLDQFIARTGSGYSCGLCGAFTHGSRSNTRNHIESRHFPNTFVYNCDICQKQCSSRQALQQHKSKKKCGAYILSTQPPE